TGTLFHVPTADFLDDPPPAPAPRRCSGLQHQMAMPAIDVPSKPAARTSGRAAAMIILNKSNHAFLR
ncbi:hypothetical protein ACFU6L_31045, partial [Kitasatospora sp. NPDC057541]